MPWKRDTGTSTRRPCTTTKQASERPWLRLRCPRIGVRDDQTAAQQCWSRASDAGESLTKLGLTYVDLWLIHWPPNGRAAPRVWEQFIKARQDGLARAIGVSNYSLSQIDELSQVTGVVPEVNQIRWGPSTYDPAVVTGLQQRGVVLEGYSPFKVSNLNDPILVSIASRHDATTAQVIVAWHVAHGFVVIPKSVRVERIVSNAAGARIRLTAEEVSAIDSLSRVAGPDPRAGSVRFSGERARVLFIGGSGIISSACSRLAVERGFDVYALNRGATSLRPLPSEVSVLHGDVREPNSVGRR